MATFQITGPDGEKYRVSGETPEGAMQALRKMVDKPAPVQQHPEFDGSNIPGYDPKTGMVERQFGKTESAAHGAADTATFGFGDELASHVASVLPGVDKPREQILAEMRGMQGGAQEQNPKSFMAGQLAGGVAQGVAGAPLTASARFAGSTLAPRVLAGMGDGAVAGSIYGAGSGTDGQSRIIESMKGGGTGLVAGGAFPLVSAGASRVYQGARNAMRAGPIAQRAGASPEALRLLGDVMDADGSLGPAGQANMARAGQDAMLADAGPNARAVLDTAIQRGGPGAIAARDAIQDRVARGSQALTGALDNTLGQPEGVTAARTAIREGSAPARGSAYEDAYRQAIDYADPRGMRIEEIVRGRVPQSAINRANELMRAEGFESQQIIARIGDNGAVTFERLPDVRQLDYITRGLNDLAEAGEGAGAMGGQNALGRAYQNLAREIRAPLRELVPEYGRALETAADPIRRSQAVDLGSRLLSPAMTRDQVAEAVEGMTGPERQALAQGVRSRIDDLMANVTRAVQDGDMPARESIKALRDLSSRANREKLATAIGEDQANQLFAEVDRIATSFDLRASVADNSRTFARQATERRIGELTQPGPIGKAGQGEPIQATKRIVQAITGMTPERIRGNEDAIYSEIAQLLTRQGGAGQGVYNAVGELGRTDQATQVMTDRIARALLGPRLSYPATALTTDNLRRD